MENGYNGRYGSMYGQQSVRQVHHQVHRHAPPQGQYVSAPSSAPRANSKYSSRERVNKEVPARGTEINVSEKVTVLRDIDIETIDEQITSTLNMLPLKIKELGVKECSLTYTEIISATIDKELVQKELQCVIEHIGKMRIMSPAVFEGEVGEYTDYLVSMLINLSFKGVQFKNIPKNINALTTIKDMDDIVWDDLISKLTNLKNSITNIATIDIPLIVTANKSWENALSNTLVKQVEYDVPLYDNMFYLALNDRVYRCIGSSVKLIKP